MPEFLKSFENSITLLKDVPFYCSGSIYYVDLIIKITYFVPDPEHFDGTIPNAQIMIDLAAMTEQLYKKYPDIDDSISFDCGADSPFMPGTEDQGYSLFPYLTEGLI